MKHTPKHPDRTQSKPGINSNGFNANHAERRLIPRPFPTSEVIEGSEIADWALWEEALAGQAGPKPTNDVKKDEESLDPFASVRKQRGAP